MEMAGLNPPQKGLLRAIKRTGLKKLLNLWSCPFSMCIHQPQGGRNSKIKEVNKMVFVGKEIHF